MTGTAARTEPVVHDVRQTADGVEIALSPPPDLLYFQGHFPGEPILPGVVQIDWAVAFADRYLGTALDAATKFRVKFSAVIRPGDSITLTLQRSPDGRAVKFSYRNGENIASTGTITLAPVS